MSNRKGSKVDKVGSKVQDGKCYAGKDRAGEGMHHLEQSKSISLKQSLSVVARQTRTTYRGLAK